MPTFTAVPSYSSSVDYAPRVLEAKFGDGYAQIIADGINSNPKKWNLNFSDVSKATAVSIVNFFITNTTATTSFTWVDPEGVTGMYKCKSWKRDYTGFDSANVTCVFEECFI